MCLLKLKPLSHIVVHFWGCVFSAGIFEHVVFFVCLWGYGVYVSKQIFFQLSPNKSPISMLNKSFVLQKQLQ